MEITELAELGNLSSRWARLAFSISPHLQDC